MAAQSMKWPVRDVSGIIRIIDFSTLIPTIGAPISGYGIGAQEDLNIMTDSNNNILFLTATDGNNIIQVRDANFNPMVNGLIRGSSTSLESAICKIPCTNDKYYFFNYKAVAQGDSLFYSIIDISLSGGLGAVTQKNIFIGKNYTEGMTISHQMRNGCRWLIVPGRNNNLLTVSAFLISNTGISPPIVLDTYTMSSSPMMPREIELSKDNKKLCLSTFTMDQNDSDVIVYDFDLESCTLSNRQVFEVSRDYVLGIEFSPDATKVYYQTNSSSTSTLGRIELSNGTNQIIDNTRDKYNSDPELARNGKIYVGCNFTDSYISEIGDPNNSNPANVQYTRHSILVDPSGCRPGFPNMIDGEPPGTSNIPTNINFSASSLSNNCNEYQFSDSTCLGTWWEWSFGDGQTSNLEFPLHRYLVTGIFDVRLRVVICDDTLSLTKSSFINIPSIQNVQLHSSPNVYCYGDHNGFAYVNITGNPPYQYLWTLPNGNTSTNDSISDLFAGNYIVRIIDASGCISTKEFTITEPPILNITMQSIDAQCDLFGSATANPVGGTPPYNYSWNTIPIQVTQTVVSLSTDIYTIIVKDSNGCITKDSIQINGIIPVLFTIESTPATCLANDGSVSVLHIGGTGNFSYHWNPVHDTTVSIVSGVPSGGYSVIATDLGTGCSQLLSTIVGNVTGVNAIISAFTNATCESNEDGSATVVALGGEPPYFYLWPNGNTTPSTNHLTSGTHIVRVEDYIGCPAYAYVTIGFDFPDPLLDLGNDTMVCNRNPIILDAGPRFITYLWNDNSTNQTYTAITSGTYSVFIEDSNGCEAFDAIELTYDTCLSNKIFNRGNILSYININPNPAKNVIHIIISNVKNLKVLMIITDVLGKKLLVINEYSNKDFEKNIDVSFLPTGIYFLTASYSDNFITQKFIKE